MYLVNIFSRIATRNPKATLFFNAPRPSESPLNHHLSGNNNSRNRHTYSSGESQNLKGML